MSGPWTIITADTDCDGTSWAAHRVDYAENREDALTQFKPGYEYSILDAIPEEEFLASDSYYRLTEWDKGYYAGRGYARLGNSWS